MDLDEFGRPKGELVTLYHWTRFAGRIRLYHAKARFIDRGDDSYYILEESHDYLGSSGNRIYKDNASSHIRKEIYERAIQRTKKGINEHLDIVQASMGDIKKWEGVLHADA